MTTLTFTVTVEVDDRLAEESGRQPEDLDEARAILAAMEEIMAKRGLDLYHSEFYYEP